MDFDTAQSTISTENTHDSEYSNSNHIMAALHLQVITRQIIMAELNWKGNCLTFGEYKKTFFTLDKY